MCIDVAESFEPAAAVASGTPATPALVCRFMFHAPRLGGAAEIGVGAVDFELSL